MGHSDGRAGFGFAMWRCHTGYPEMMKTMGMWEKRTVFDPRKAIIMKWLHWFPKWSPFCSQETRLEECGMRRGDKGMKVPDRRLGRTGVMLAIRDGEFTPKSLDVNYGCRNMYTYNMYLYILYYIILFYFILYYFILYLLYIYYISIIYIYVIYIYMCFPTKRLPSGVIEHWESHFVEALILWIRIRRIRRRCWRTSMWSVPPASDVAWVLWIPAPFPSSSSMKQLRRAWSGWVDVYKDGAVKSKIWQVTLW